MLKLMLCLLLAANLLAPPLVAAAEELAPAPKTESVPIESVPIQSAPVQSSTAAPKTVSPSHSTSDTSALTPVAVTLTKEELEAKELKANEIFRKRDYKGSEKACAEIVTSLGGTSNVTKDNVRPLYNLALCLILNDKVSEAKPILHGLHKFLEKSNNDSKIAHADVMNLLAECDYIEGRVDKALDLYLQAWNVYEKEFGRYCQDNVSCLEGMSGSLFRLEKHDQSIDILKALARTEHDSGGESSLRFSITLRMMSACYKAKDDMETAKKLYDYAFAVARMGTYKRLLEQCAQKVEKGELSTTNLEVAKGRLHKLMFGTGDFDAKRARAASILPEVFATDGTKAIKRPSTFANWTLPANDEGVEIPPLVIDPIQETKAVVICIHGFSLSRDSFSDFAKRFAARGYAVASIDMAGFGAFTGVKGVDVVRPDLWLEQVANSVSQIKKDNPDLPIILMGESMGGAIALQAAVRVQDKLSGLVCSVPAGERYGKTKENFKVGTKLLRSRWRPMDVGADLALQMFSDPDKRDEYLNNAKARSSAAPEELVRFQMFMNQNEECAPKITTLPVIMFQGFSDRLVKPKGTAELYGAIGSKDKDLIVIGKQEHLVFEQGQCPEWVIACLDGWIDAKALKEKASKTAALGSASP